jgi:hypothetical protein
VLQANRAMFFTTGAIQGPATEGAAQSALRGTDPGG